jgi:hypothetical protein
VDWVVRFWPNDPPQVDDVECQSQAHRWAELAWPLLPEPSPRGSPSVRDSSHRVDV